MQTCKSSSTRCVACNKRQIKLELIHQLSNVVTSKGQGRDARACHDLEAHHVLKRSQGKNPWDHVPVRAKIQYELKKTRSGARRCGWSWRTTDGALRDVEQWKTFVEQTENWWEMMRTEAEEMCRNGDVERGWSLSTEGRGWAKLPADASRAETRQRRNTSPSNVGIRTCRPYIKQR